SSLPLARRWPSGLKATLRTTLPWPRRVASSAPLRASHSLTVLSSLPLASRRPSGLNATIGPAPCREYNRSAARRRCRHSQPGRSRAALVERVGGRVEGLSLDLPLRESRAINMQQLIRPRTLALGFT